jgi:DNA (cytosine-5)-methyltransferase 1
MNELALFAGAGGGILGGRLLGWRTVCAVEIDPYCRQILLQRQNDGMLEPSQSGTMCEPLTGDRGLDSWMSSLADSRARTSALQERAPESKESKAAFGGKWRASLARFDPGSCSWRTPQLSFLEEFSESLATFPRWGTMRNGELWERTMPELPTKENASGFWPTPTANDAKNSTFPPSCRAWDSLPGELIRRELAIPGSGQVLSPYFVEWLMGWPFGWTNLKPLETDKYQQWYDSHGTC